LSGRDLEIGFQFDIRLFANGALQVAVGVLDFINVLRFIPLEKGTSIPPCDPSEQEWCGGFDWPVAGVGGGQRFGLFAFVAAYGGVLHAVVALFVVCFAVKIMFFYN